MSGTGERGTIARQPLGRGFLVAGAAHDVAPGGGERVDLRERAVDVGGLGGGHRLHRHRRGSAHRDVTDVDLPRDAPLHHMEAIGTGLLPPMTWRTSRNIADSAIVIRMAKNATPIGSTLR